MEEVKEKISELLADEYNIGIIQAKSMFEFTKEKNMGDITLPCFKLASVMKMSPPQIASVLKEKISKLNINEIVDIQNVGGYLNIWVDTEKEFETILKDCILSTKNNEKYVSSNVGKNKTIVVDYSSPNIAKPFHIGHLRTTVIGHAICKMHKAMGYKVVGVNYLGDFGTQFGYVIEGYNRWKDEYDLSINPIAKLVEIYVRINAMAKEDESIVECARANFKKLEQGDEEVVKLWKHFRELSLEEYKKVYARLNISFDSYNGEAYYSDKMGEIVDTLTNKGVLVESEGAKVVNLINETVPCMILKTNGSTTYATRDLAAILDRARTYDYTKCLYVTGSEQMLHFKQVFETAKYVVDEKYSNGLIHVPFGMILGKGGKKLSTRKGATTTIDDILNEAVDKAKEVLIKKGKVEQDDMEETANIIGIGSVIFNDLKNSRIKDEIFELDEMLKFEGETAPYVQYTCVRTKSILEKANYVPDSSDVKIELYNLDSEIELLKTLGKAKEKLAEAVEELEPYIITRYVLEVASNFSRVYNDCQILCEDEQLKKARLVLVYATKTVLEECLDILNIKCPNKM